SHSVRNSNVDDSSFPDSRPGESSGFAVPRSRPGPQDRPHPERSDQSGCCKQYRYLRRGTHATKSECLSHRLSRLGARACPEWAAFHLAGKRPIHEQRIRAPIVAAPKTKLLLL